MISHFCFLDDSKTLPAECNKCITVFRKDIILERAVQDLFPGFAKKGCPGQVHFGNFPVGCECEIACRSVIVQVKVFAFGTFCLLPKHPEFFILVFEFFLVALQFLEEVLGLFIVLLEFGDVTGAYLEFSCFTVCIINSTDR